MAENADLTKLFTNANITPLPNDNEITNCLNDTVGTEHIGIYCTDKNGNYTITVRLTDIINLINLINCQKAEIEALQDEVAIKTSAYNDMKEQRDKEHQYCMHYVGMIAKFKSEAIKNVLLTLEAEAESSDKYIREYEDSKEQRAYNQALRKACNLVKEMVGE